MAQEQQASIAFKSLFDREYENLCRYAYSYLKDEHLAEDVVQSTFVKMWEQKQDLLTSENARFYLVTSVRNNSISELRKGKNTFYPEEQPTTEAQPFFSHMLHREECTEQQQRIARALDMLPPKCKEIFLMVKLHDMSYKQVAESLELSVKTVENQMGKAIKTFKTVCVAVVLSIYSLVTMKNFMLQ